MRIASWNIERLAPYLAPRPQQLPLTLGSPAAPVRAAAPPLAQVVEALERPELLCLQEIRLRPGDVGLQHLARQALPDYRVDFSLCDDARNAKVGGGRLYGVATYVRDDVPPCRWHRFAWDREGRVLVADIADWNLVVVNWYGVNGTERPYVDPDSGVADGDRHAFKLRTQQRLLEACRAWRKTRHLVVIGDVNVTPQAIDITPRLRTQPPHVAARRHMAEVFCPELGLLDAWRRLHPTAKNYTWFNRLKPRGKLDAARVDYALVSEALMPNLEAAGLATAPEARYNSDHAPIHIDLRLPLPKAADVSSLA